DGQHAIDLLSNSYVDLIILDIMMPKMDGFSVAAKLKEDPSTAHIPIIFLSAKTDEYSKALGQMSASDYIEKPFEIGDLKSRIQEVIGK
ncbi:MAG: response regulator, partial [Nanoarchaeota archaeon]